MIDERVLKVMLLYRKTMLNELDKILDSFQEMKIPEREAYYTIIESIALILADCCVALVDETNTEKMLDHICLNALKSSIYLRENMNHGQQ